MGMLMEVQTMIITKGNEKRSKGNLFELTKTGYRLYPLHVPLEIRKTKESDSIGIGTIQKIIWEKDTTILFYELTSLHSTN